MEGRLRANMLWDSIVRYKTERGALGSKTGYPRRRPERRRRAVQRLVQRKTGAEVRGLQCSTRTR
jgi:hypothetical protein